MTEQRKEKGKVTGLIKGKGEKVSEWLEMLVECKHWVMN